MRVSGGAALYYRTGPMSTTICKNRSFFERKDFKPAKKGDSIEFRVTLNIGPPAIYYFFSLIQNSVFCPRRYNSPAAITGVAMKI